MWGGGWVLDGAGGVKSGDRTCGGSGELEDN